MLSTLSSQAAVVPLPPDYSVLAQQMLYAVRTGEPAGTFKEQLQVADAQILQQQLYDDAHRKAFWLNLYNAFVQDLLRKNSDRYNSRSAFFSRKQVVVAGTRLSLDDIEHGILRRSKNKWSLGYVGKLFPGSFEKRFRVDQVDYRIHFALNCGARSCLPIAYYSADKIDRQLDLATRAYLSTEAAYSEADNKLQLPAIMGWFRADFGGKKGIKTLLRQQQLVPAHAHPSIRFKPYDWTLYLDNYKNENHE